MSAAHCRIPVAKQRTSISMRPKTVPKVAPHANMIWGLYHMLLIDYSEFSLTEK